MKKRPDPYPNLNRFKENVRAIQMEKNIESVSKVTPPIIYGSKRGLKTNKNCTILQSNLFIGLFTIWRFS